MSTVAIHQSQYIPWPPYFKKMALADIFVIMDNVQFQKNGVQNRNKIRNANRDFWLTIPVTGRLEDLIADKKISDGRWKEKHWKSLKLSYAKAPFWGHYADDLEDLYNQEYATIGEINGRFLEYLIKMLNIKTKVVYLSDLEVSGTKSDLVLGICKALNAKIYISGLGAKAYLKENDFLKEGIVVKYKPSASPAYRQFHGEFISELSILDMMFNVSPNDIGEYLKRAAVNND